jgi:chromosome partitioning protein
VYQQIIGKTAMRTIALISQKGGVGKTTLAIHLATAFAAGGYHTLLLDLDPQASAAEWKDARASETPAVLAAPPARLPKVIEEARRISTDILIIDTAPHSEGTALDAARAADLILVPCQPSIMDLRALRKTTDLLEHVKKPTYAVLNVVSPHGSVTEEAATTITTQFKLPVCEIRLGDRVAYNRCLIKGETAQEFEPDGKAAREFTEFYKWASNLVGLSARKRKAA